MIDFVAMDNVELVVPAAAMAAEAKPKVRTNWATNIIYSTSDLHEVSSIEEIQALLQSEEQVQTAGTGHTFNFIADSLHKRLSLRLLHRVLHLDVPSMTVTVAAGIKYDQLCPFLHHHGLALPNLASLTELSIAGAISTAAHGSGDGNRCLATTVTALEMATPNGELLHLSRHTHEVGNSFP